MDERRIKQNKVETNTMKYNFFPSMYVCKEANTLKLSFAIPVKAGMFSFLLEFVAVQTRKIYWLTCSESTDQQMTPNNQQKASPVCENFHPCTCSI